MTAEQAGIKDSFVHRLFLDEPAGAFSHGHIFVHAPDITDDQRDPEIGYWHCDIAHGDRLIWSDKVYELFGLPRGSAIDRDEAVARYSDVSRTALENVRTFAISRKLGFILDADISLGQGEIRWIRVLAIPILGRGRVVGVHGLKRAL
jgi:PAS domain-containing protein